MSDQPDRADQHKRETISLEEATISKMWEIAALVEVLERKGLCTKQDLWDILVELRKKSPALGFLKRCSRHRTSFPTLKRTSSMMFLPS